VRWAVVCGVVAVLAGCSGPGLRAPDFSGPNMVTDEFMTEEEEQNRDRHYHDGEEQGPPRHGTAEKR
jgi:hypothetical protein